MPHIIAYDDEEMAWHHCFALNETENRLQTTFCDCVLSCHLKSNAFISVFLSLTPFLSEDFQHSQWYMVFVIHLMQLTEKL